MSLCGAQMIHPDFVSAIVIQFWLIVLDVPALLLVVARVFFRKAVEATILILSTLGSNI